MTNDRPWPEFEALLPKPHLPAGAFARRAAMALAMSLGAWLPPANAQMAAGTASPAAAGSQDFSFEQLATMEVSGVSKSAERVIDAPAAVTVVTGDEIRAFGWRTLADLLPVAPGFFTYSDRAYTYVGVRGFAPIESYNSRVLLLIDGFPANDGVFEQALIGNEGIVDPSLIDRVEIIPGPSSSVYGTNAVLGVINVILKSPSRSGPRADAWAGSGVERGASATYAAGESDVHYLIQASASRSAGLDVVYAPQPGLPAGARVQGQDGSDVSRAFAKIISGNLRVNLSISERRQRAGYGLYGDVIGDPRSWVSDTESFADARYEGSLGDATDYVLRASLAQYRFDGEIVDAYPGYPAVPGFSPMESDWFDTEATATHHFSADNRLVFGAQVRRDYLGRMSYTDDLQGLIMSASDSFTRAGLYAQSDIDWTDRWSTSLGLRGDAGSAQQPRLSPRVAVLWKIAPEQALKLLFGTAFRDPSFFERMFAQPPLNLANPALTPERLRTLDLDYEAPLGEAGRLALTLFQYHAFALISQDVVNPALGTVQYLNSDAAQARGVDLALDERLRPGLRLRLSAEFVRTVDVDGSTEDNSPPWTGRLGLIQELPRDWRVAAEGQFEGHRLALDNNTLPGFFVANCVVSRTPRPGQLDVSLGVYNVFGREYAQPTNGWAGDQVDQLGRTWRLTLGYSF